MSEPVKRGRWVGGAATRDGGMTTGRGPRGPATHRPHDRVREREREEGERGGRQGTQGHSPAA